MSTIPLNGSEIYYREQGKGDIPIVFGHGLMLSSNMWKSFYLPSLPDRYRGYALDFRGHGRSAKVEGCTIRRMADDVYEFALKCGLGKFVYVGVSMGGGVGVQLALDHPESLSALVLYSPMTGLGRSGVLMFRLLGSFFAGKRWLVRPMMRGLCIRKPPEDSLERAVDEAMLVSARSLREFVADKLPIRGLEHLDLLTVPTLVVIGGKDTAVPVSQQKELGLRIPGAKIVMYPEEGHMVTYEKQDEVFSETMTFLESVVPA